MQITLYNKYFRDSRGVAVRIPWVSANMIYWKERVWFLIYVLVSLLPPNDAKLTVSQHNSHVMTYWGYPTCSEQYCYGTVYTEDGEMDLDATMMQAAIPTKLKRDIHGRNPISQSILEGFFLAKGGKMKDSCISTVRFLHGLVFTFCRPAFLAASKCQVSFTCATYDEGCPCNEEWEVQCDSYGMKEGSVAALPVNWKNPCSRWLSATWDSISIVFWCSNLGLSDSFFLVKSQYENPWKKIGISLPWKKPCSADLPFQVGGLLWPLRCDLWQPWSFDPNATSVTKTSPSPWSVMSLHCCFSIFILQLVVMSSLSHVCQHLNTTQGNEETDPWPY